MVGTLEVAAVAVVEGERVEVVEGASIHSVVAEMRQKRIHPNSNAYNGAAGHVALQVINLLPDE